MERWNQSVSKQIWRALCEPCPCGRENTVAHFYDSGRAVFSCGTCQATFQRQAPARGSWGDFDGNEALGEGEDEQGYMVQQEET